MTVFSNNDSMTAVAQSLVGRPFETYFVIKNKGVKQNPEQSYYNSASSKNFQADGVLKSSHNSSMPYSSIKDSNAELSNISS